jgi:hypothetical protein
MEKTSLPFGVAFVSMSEITRYVPQFTIDVGQLGKAKRGDWVKLAVRFPHRCDYCGKGCQREGTTECEFISAKISGLNPGLSVLTCRILSVPAHTTHHSLAFEDDLTVGLQYVLGYVEMPAGPVVEQSTGRVNYGTAAEEHLLTGVKPAPTIINAEDQRLRDAVKNLPALAPSAGKRYWLRNGAVVTVWTERGGVWIGKADDGDELEWTPAGAHAGGNRDFDIVRDPTAKEVFA